MSKRMIEVSMDVYAAIWAERHPGEDCENDVLSRVLKVTSTPANVPTVSQKTAGAGFHDMRNGVVFPEGFVIFRDYKGKRYEAVATAGQWVRSDSGVAYPSLNQLNGSFAAGSENVWNGAWRYIDDKGTNSSIDTLRN